MADFESADAKFGNSTTYSGTKNTAGDYSDFVKPEWVADGGKENSTGLRITYKAATWYAGEVFFPIPVVQTVRMLSTLILITMAKVL